MEDSLKNIFLEAALKYASLGLKVFPCIPKTKKPMTTHGFHDATTEAKTIKSWWTKNPDANIGIATGAVSGILIIDVDRRNGGDYSWDELINTYGPVPETPYSFTGNGRHFFFKHPGRFIQCSQSKFAAGIDIKADGGYIIAPPSIHPDGPTYGWEASSEIGDIQPAALPPWLLDLILKPCEESKTDETWRIEDMPLCEGSRNQMLTRLGGYLRRAGLDEIAVTSVLERTNLLRCRPPLSDKEVGSIAKSVCRYESDQTTVAHIEAWEERLLELGIERVVDIVCLTDVETKPIQWLWPQRIAIGKLSIIAGDPGLGKSFLTLDIAARISTGAAWPDQPDYGNAPGSIILLSAEDDPSDTIKPRLLNMDADCSKIHALKAVKTPEGKQRCFDLGSDLEILKAVIKNVPDCRLIIIDPISAYLGKLDGHSNSEIRGLLAPLSDMAAEYNVALVAVTHLNKGGGSNPLYRAMGSLAFVAAARTVWTITRDNDDGVKESPRRLMLPAKNNIAEDNSGLSYMLVNGRVVWDETTMEMTAGKFFREQTEHEDKHFSPARSEAQDFLMEVLKDGPILSKEVQHMAKEAGINHNTLSAAKKELNIRATRIGAGKDGKWFWLLPGQTISKETSSL